MTRTALRNTIFGAAALTAIILIFTWLFGGFEGLSDHGIGALIAGTVGAIGLGIALMSVVFISSRSGYDHAAYDATRSHVEKPPRANE